MNYNRDFKFRYDLATQYLKEVKEDFELKRYRSCVDNAQFSVENSLKAVLALFGPIEKNHKPEEYIKSDYGD